MLSIIVAVSENDVIGYGGKMPWHISEDLKYFKKITMGKTLIMGRKTYESLPGALPGRKLIIITKDKNFLNTPSDDIFVCTDLTNVLLHFKNTDEEAFIIGGAEIYKQSINWADCIYLTKIYKTFEGDVYFPEIDYSIWKITESSGIRTDRSSQISYEFLKLKPKG